MASKNVVTDIKKLTKRINNGGFSENKKYEDMLRYQCELFLEGADRVNYTTEIDTIPVFVDWNIGNFSVRNDGKFYSRWDYDWFRESTRVMDFYFFSRVVSDIGDRTVFSYLVDPLMEDRFMMFLKEYHRIYPLTEPEIRLIKEIYRFFILNYVIKDGPYFFRESFAKKLRQEAFDLYFPSLDKNYKVEKILKTLKI